MADDTLTVEQARQRLETAVWVGDDVAEPIDALIAAVRAETLAEYTLTDSDVDKFLAACEAPVDPARVERIRKLFLQKLDGGS